LVAIAGLLYGCSGGKAQDAAPQQSTAPIFSDPFGLPGPYELAAATTRPREVSAAVLSLTGSEYVPGHGQLVAVEGTDLRFTPDFDEQSRALDGVAYAIYRFNLQGVEFTHTLSISWMTPPAKTADLWLGLSRWDTGYWEWYSAFNSDSLELSYSARDYFSEPSSGDLYVVVLLTGTAEAVLEQLALNGNSTPVAQITADPTSGAPPLLVSFDASGSSSSAGDIVKYEWDWDSDGNWDEDTEAVPATSHEYEAGSYTAWVRVTDEIGGIAAASISISAAAQAAWPMFGHDAQNTHRSPYVGAQTNNVKWTFTTGGNVNSSPAIDANGTVYISSRDGNLYAINPDGSQKWFYDLGDYELGVWLSSPAIGLEGTVYIDVPSYMVSHHAFLYAINPDGSLKWTYDVGGDVNPFPESPTIGIDGVVYVKGAKADGYSVVHAIYPDGSLKWTWSNDGVPIADTYPALGLDGIVYQSFIGQFRAINPDGSLKWKYSNGSTIIISPAIGANGTIYVTSAQAGEIYAFNLDGSILWSKAIPGGSAAIGADGTIYTRSQSKLNAINADGSLDWVFDMGIHATHSEESSSPAIGADGTLYLGGGRYIYAINSDGSLKWEYKTGDWVNSSPAIGADGTVYVGSRDDKLYAFGP
jgi:outer membrane protein assembly factor BamB